MEKLNRKYLKKWKKEDLIDLIILRNDDAKNYAREITILLERNKKKLTSEVTNLDKKYEEELND